MKKFVLDFRVKSCRPVHQLYSLLVLEPLSPEQEMPRMLPGQFVQVRVDNSATFLRRPISINDVDHEARELSLLVRDAGEGTRWMIGRKAGDVVNLLLPLGNGFSLPADGGADYRPLLVGGGVGIAPMLYLAREMHRTGIRPTVLIGARSKADVLEYDEFAGISDVHVTTEDGSMGEAGLVTASSVWTHPWDEVMCCGPAPMMKAIAAQCRKAGVRCKVSLENMMACGLGACLCCVEKTVRGNVCVCTEGPVFDTDELTW